MTIRQDFLQYHKSIGQELKNSEDRIRNLIGGSHWLTDGEHKENILRKVISDFAPEIFKIGSGFVCYPADGTNSHQIDILVTSKMTPTLYKSGDIHFVTPECVNAIIEVKTKLTNGQNIDGVIEKLAQDISKIRRSQPNCWAGLFIYKTASLNEEHVLSSLQRVVGNDHTKIINCVAIGENKFIRYWENGHSQSGLGNEPVWHAYDLRDLAHPYLISNLVSHLSPRYEEESAEAWFPISGGKEIHKTKFAFLTDTNVRSFV